MSETWAPIPGFDGYAASSAGAIMGPRGLLSTPRTQGGYLTCSLCREGKKTTTTVQRLVLLAFVGQPPTPEHEANHKNGKKTDNRPCNLEWVTPAENKRHAVEVLGSKPGRKKTKPPAPENHPKPGAYAGRIVAELYGQHFEMELRVPGDEGQRRARSDHLAVNIDGEWRRVSLRAALLQLDQMVPRVMSRKERAGL